MQELDHQSRKSLVRSGGSNLGVDLDQDFFGGCNVNLQEARLVQWAVQKGQDFLVQNIGAKAVGVFSKLLFAKVSMVIAIE